MCMSRVLTIYQVENGWLIAAGDGDPAKQPSRRMVAVDPAIVGILATTWAEQNPPANPMIVKDELVLDDSFKFPPASVPLPPRPAAQPAGPPTPPR
jgi:hypothetical protein